MRKPTTILAAALALTMLAGCGQQPTSAPRAPRPARQQITAPGAGGAMPGAMGQPGMPGFGVPGGMRPGMGGQGRQEGERLKQAAAQAYQNAKGFEGELRSFGEGHYKSGSYEAEARTSISRLKLVWLKPAKMAGEIIETSNPLLEGGKLATTDGQNITARAKGLLSLFPIKLQATDQKMRNIRNHPFAETTPNGLMNRILAPGAAWTAVTQGQVEGTPCVLVQIDNVRRLDKEITREVLAIDPQTAQVRRVTSYAGDRRVMEYTFLSFRWNPKVSADRFNL